MQSWSCPTQVLECIAGCTSYLEPFTRNDVLINSGSGAEFDASKTVKLCCGATAGEALLLQGGPIAELTVQHGPFAMSFLEESDQAFVDTVRGCLGSGAGASAPAR